MNELVLMCTIVSVFLMIFLMAFAIFTIGFLIGYKREEKKIISTKKQEEFGIQETEEEKKIRREWKNFLKYDGSAIENQKEI